MPIANEIGLISAEVPLALVGRLEALANRLERPPSWIVTHALTAYIDREDEQIRLTLEGMADVSAGRIVSHAAVQAWAKSLETPNPFPVPSA